MKRLILTIISLATAVALFASCTSHGSREHAVRVAPKLSFNIAQSRYCNIVHQIDAVVLPIKGQVPVPAQADRLEVLNQQLINEVPVNRAFDQAHMSLLESLVTDFVSNIRAEAMYKNRLDGEIYDDYATAKDHLPHC